jgi:ligand-binding SRPBCC domain-containing protein
MRFTHRFTVPAPQHVVAAFHRRSDSLVAITPPSMPMRLRQAPAQLGAGDEIAFTFWLGPFPVRWRARIEQMHSDSFTDCMIEGPFRMWHHRHTFRVIDDGTTEVLDEIDFSLKPHPLWGPMGLAMAVGLPLLFSHRARKTVQLIIRESDSFRIDVVD